MNVCDECYTMDASWDMLYPFLPKDKLLYDPFRGDSFARWAQAKGLRAQAGNDFWGTPIPADCVVVTNPPFTIRAEVIRTLIDRGVPFVMLLNYGTLRMNVMNSVPDACFVFWGRHHLFSMPNGTTQRSFSFALLSRVQAPRFTWVKAPEKAFPSEMCPCGSLVQRNHRKAHEKQPYHKQRTTDEGGPQKGHKLSCSNDGGTDSSTNGVRDEMTNSNGRDDKGTTG